MIHYATSSEEDQLKEKLIRIYSLITTHKGEISEILENLHNWAKIYDQSLPIELLREYDGYHRVNSAELPECRLYSYQKIVNKNGQSVKLFGFKKTIPETIPDWYMEFIQDHNLGIAQSIEELSQSFMDTELIHINVTEQIWENIGKKVTSSTIRPANIDIFLPISINDFRNIESYVKRFITDFVINKLKELSYDFSGEEMNSGTMFQYDGEIQPEIAIITALAIEHAAMKSLIIDPIENIIPGNGAGRRYTFGRIPSNSGGDHEVVLTLTTGIGNNNAATRATQLLLHYPSVKSIIMVGIAGAVPYPEKVDEHVRLGDVVVSNEKGVIQYDFITKESTITELRYSPRPPSAFLLEAIKYLSASHIEGKTPWINYIDDNCRKLSIKRPSVQTDVLKGYDKLRIRHPKDPDRNSGQPRIFSGPIAAANILLKDPEKRDTLRDAYGVKAVEMESSGIADATWAHEKGYLVIRGTCDYCDVDKGDKWQQYAAIVASAYCRALIESIPVNGKQPSTRDLQVRNKKSRIKIRNSSLQNITPKSDDSVEKRSSQISIMHNENARIERKTKSRNESVERFFKKLQELSPTNITAINGMLSILVDKIQSRFHYIDDLGILPVDEGILQIIANILSFIMGKDYLNNPGLQSNTIYLCDIISAQAKNSLLRSKGISKENNQLCANFLSIVHKQLFITFQELVTSANWELLEYEDQYHINSTHLHLSAEEKSVIETFIHISVCDWLTESFENHKDTIFRWINNDEDDSWLDQLHSALLSNDYCNKDGDDEEKDRRRQYYYRRIELTGRL